jgi:hypothetical protein
MATTDYNLKPADGPFAAEGGIRDWVKVQTEIREIMASLDSGYKPKTLEDYFEHCKQHYVIDHSIRYIGDGRAYIHPARQQGPTFDIIVRGNTIEN